MKITLDGKELTATPGRTIIEVAREQGLDIPTLCYLERGEGETCSTSCLVCLVRANGKIVPACATKIEDGMVVESETSEIRRLRKTALELLLSDHRGDCHAPCQLACPAGLDIPKMLREIRDGNAEAAIRTIKETIPLPAVLGRVCPKPCEKVCRRKDIDSPVAICEMKRHAADLDLAREAPYRPSPAEQSGKRVLVVGAGPSGLSAAFYLARSGHGVALYAQGKKPGGRLRNIPELPGPVLDAEIRTILSLPIDYYPDETLDWTVPDSLVEMRRSFDAVLLCTGPCDPDLLKKSGFEVERDRLRVDTKTWTTSITGIFATGTIFRAKTTMVVRSVADGREAAMSVDRFLRTGRPFAAPAPFTVKLGKLSTEELHALANANLVETGTLADEPAGESARCLRCDCRGREKCLLLRHSKTYKAETNRFASRDEKRFVIRRSGNVVFEPGKCIKCGLCISITKRLDEETGLAFFGRGFNVRVDVPFGGMLHEALEKSAAEAVRACPTAALSFEDAFHDVLS